MSAVELHEDDCLRLPLDGVQLIEASAGTGKTFTLATLFTRLVIERQLRIGRILAVTFTDAATQELRKRIRERLQLASRLAGTTAGDGEDHETALTRAILERHLRQGTETAAQLARRLRIAAEETDLAAIFTIHGFCARVLSEHAIDSGHAFDVPELLTNLKPLHADIAADVWRMHASSAETQEALTALWSGPDALADDLHDLLRDLPLLPEPDTSDGIEDAISQWNLARAGLQRAWRAHGETFVDMVSAAIAAGVMNRTSYNQDWLKELRQWLRAFEGSAVAAGAGHPKLEKLTAEALARGTRKDRKPGMPVCPELSEAVATYLAANEILGAANARRRATLLHRIRDQARERIALLKRQRRLQTYDDLIDGVADALEGPRGRRLVEALRKQYRVALVDEFQDTDARQWAIFRRVFGDSGEVRAIGETPALFVIGDPKQAIYGFRGGDVQTYLQAKQHAAVAPPLQHNFRSRPALLRAIEALYANAGDAAFIEHGIRFEPVLPGGTRSDGDYLHDGMPAPALTVRLLRSDDGAPLNADRSREAATAACVADIHRVLSAARAGRASIDGKPVQPGDIAVLVRTHREATRVQQALAAAGIPAVAAGKQSLYETPEAQELRLLLLALLLPADDGRLRAALSTVLLGFDAAAIASLDHDGDALRAAQDDLLQWRERWQRGGPFALVSDLCAAHAERLLALFDGERRVTNYLQLAERLQEAAAQTLGMHGLLDWLQRQMARADKEDDTQLLRLESDAHRVQIVTLHKSKGLEYPLVYLPFAGIGGKPPNTARHHAVHDGTRRALHWKIAKDAAWNDAERRAAGERDAEAARLLYVGLTRAQHALWVAGGNLRDAGDTRLAPLLSDLDALRADAGTRIVDGPAEPPPSRLPPERDAAVPPPRIARRHIASDWWVYSFTQLAHADAGHDTDAASTEAEAAATDEPVQTTDGEATADAFDRRFSGSRFGNVLHAALEKTGFAAWAGWREGDDAPAGEGEALRQALRAEGYAHEDLDDGLALLTSLVGRTLTVALPEGDALHALGEHERRAEIEFHFAMQPVAVPALLDLLHAHGVVQGRHGFGLRRRLEGLMTGKIDLTYTHDGRWYVLDYKSNRLPRYDAAHLAAAMAHSEYDLQALVYTVALHRWLRFRLGDGYDYARDFGGIRYLFCRGLGPQDDASQGASSKGIFAHRFAPELVHALDALFANKHSAAPPLPLAGEGRGEGRHPHAPQTINPGEDA